MEEAAARAAGPGASRAELGRARRRAKSALGKADAEVPPGTHDPPGQAAGPEWAGQVPAPRPRSKALSAMPKAAATAAAMAGRRPGRGPPGNQRRSGAVPERSAALAPAVAALLDGHAEAAWTRRARAAVAALPPPAPASTPRPPPRLNPAALAAGRHGR
jgi:hypothetical protein